MKLLTSQLLASSPRPYVNSCGCGRMVVGLGMGLGVGIGVGLSMPVQGAPQRLLLHAEVRCGGGFAGNQAQAALAQATGCSHPTAALLRPAHLLAAGGGDDLDSRVLGAVEQGGVDQDGGVCAGMAP